MSETNKSFLDEASLQAVSSISSASTATTKSTVVSAPTFRMAVSSAAIEVKAIYDPIVMEQAQAYKELNDTVRFGFAVPTASTK